VAHRTKALRAKAAALGLPLVDYVQTLTMAIRLMDGGRARFLELVQMAAADGDDDAIKFVTCFTEQGITARASVSFDLVCMAAGVVPVSLLKTVVGIAFEAGVETANLVAASAHPSIVAATIKSAKRITSKIGLADRETLHRHHGFTPLPRGTTVNVNANATAQAAAAAADREPSVPRFLDDAEAAQAPQRALQRQLITEGTGTDPLASIRAMAREAELVPAATARESHK
jgi:hypothetical protein